jgi:TonB family protein
MKRWFCIVVAVLLATVLTSVLTSVLTWAQQPQPDSSNTLRFDTGVLSNGIYSNECFGFSLPIPAGWEVNEGVTAGGKAARHFDNSFLLLFLQQQGKLRGRILLSAWDPVGYSGNAQKFVSDAVRTQIASLTEHRELVRDAYPVDYGGGHFFRADNKARLHDGNRLFMAYVYTEFRGYIVGETVASGSPEGLDEAANSLRAISFQQDEVNPKCVLGPEEPGSPLQLGRDVTSGSLIKSVPPDYPPIARQARVQGPVVLKAIIDKDGNIESLTLISGHPMLAPAAIEAVKQWKYKPYMHNGQPVKVETQILVNFSLSGG